MPDQFPMKLIKMPCNTNNIPKKELEHDEELRLICAVMHPQQRVWTRAASEKKDDGMMML
jgi:hypothetical protein